MHRWLSAATLVAALLGLAACAAKEEAKPAPAAAPPAAAGAAKPAWEEEWERVLAAAKREGKVVVTGPPGADVRKVLVDSFQRKFGITVEYSALRGAETAPRIKVERDAGQYLWDVYIGGSSTPLVNLKPAGALDPIEPLFIMPDLKDPKTYRLGDVPFMDKDRLVYAMVGQTSEAFLINRNLVDPKEFKSYRDILQPKWKGKILLHDPRISGSGQGRVQFYFMHPELGTDFIRALARQEPVIMRDYEQMIEWVAVGRYALSIGGDTNITDPMIKAGVPLAYVPQRQMREGGYIGTSQGVLALFNRAPHPNAAKIYVNWLLSKEGSTEFSRATGYVSRRGDVPTDHVDSWQIPVPTDIATDNEEARLAREKVRDFAIEIWGR